MTVFAGLIAAHYGPVTGGLFLAFPAIFPASATLIEKHERQRKERAGLSAGRRGKNAAALDSAGAVMGSIGLAAFAGLTWMMSLSVWLTFMAATVAWMAVSFLLWWARRYL